MSLWLPFGPHEHESHDSFLIPDVDMPKVFRRLCVDLAVSTLWKPSGHTCPD